MRGREDSAYKVGKPSVNVSPLAACLSVDEQHLGFGASQEVLLAPASSHRTGFIAFQLELRLTSLNSLSFRLVTFPGCRCWMRMDLQKR